MSGSTRRILAADIGGTHSRLAVFRVETAAPRLVLEQRQWLDSREFSSFTELLRVLRSPLAETAVPLLADDDLPDMAVFAAAGPVQGESCRIPNLSWEISVRDAQQATGISRVLLCNDLAAQAFACLLPEHLNVKTIAPGEPIPGAAVAVVGAGTGFGKAVLLRDRTANRRGAPDDDEFLDTLPAHDPLRGLCAAQVLPSEGGHALFPFVGPEEFAFAEFAAGREPDRGLIGDAIVSGAGLTHIAAFFTGKNMSPREAVSATREHPQILSWFARFYGRFCRNFVLDVLALGGLYITGGMALHVPVLQRPEFLEEFRASSAHRRLLARIPVRQICNPEAGLWGAALYGLCAGA